MGYEKNWWGFSLSLRLCFNIGSYCIVIYCVIEFFSNVFNPYLVCNQLILSVDWITSMKKYYKNIDKKIFLFDLNLVLESDLYLTLSFTLTLNLKLTPHYYILWWIYNVTISKSYFTHSIIFYMMLVVSKTGSLVTLSATFVPVPILFDTPEGCFCPTVSWNENLSSNSACFKVFLLIWLFYFIL